MEFKYFEKVAIFIFIINIFICYKLKKFERYDRRKYYRN